MLHHGCGGDTKDTAFEIANQAPISVAGGNQSVTVDSSVILDGSASRDPNGDPLSYRWSLTAKPNGSSASLSLHSSAKPSFIADLAGTYVATLIVND
ncbi:MAG: PKD domain-containing protein, partial [Betaproteobacteria bacterium]|nr:PKD domain-containing protein [Betaproteobacteria bacterium]